VIVMQKKRADKYEKKLAVKESVTFTDIISVVVKNPSPKKAKKKSKKG
jgi:hypothetical protein